MTLLDGAIAVSAIGTIPWAARRGLADIGERIVVGRRDAVGLVAGALLALCAALGNMPGLAILCVSLTVSALTDIRRGVVLDMVVGVSLVSLGAAAWADGALPSFASGAVVVCLVMAVIYGVARGGLGLGDVKLASVLGGALGVGAGLSALALAFVAGGIVAATAFAMGRIRRDAAIPFAPFVVTGAALEVAFESVGIVFP